MYKFTVKDPHFLPHCGCQIELSPGKGDFFTLVGENGVGKSTLARAVFDQNQQLITYIEQGPTDAFYDRPLRRIKEIFLSGGSNEITRARFTHLWNSFQLKNKEDRKQSELSGGEGQLLKLCLGLSIDREVYLLDEPSQFLDIAMKEKLKQAIQDLLHQQKTILMIEHDLSWSTLPMKVHELKVENGILKEGRSWTT